MKRFIYLSFLILIAYTPYSSGNGWLENRSFQFISVDARYLLLMQTQQREISRHGGYSSTYNITYNGENMQIGDQYNSSGNQTFNNSNAIGNISNTTINGNSNTVTTGQDNNQGSNSSTAIGEDLSPFIGGIGFNLGTGG